jgi:hypothetical protein
VQAGLNQYSNHYIHGFTHVAFASVADCSGTHTGACFSLGAFYGQGSSHSTIGPGNVCDGSDSDPGGFGCILSITMYNVFDNIFRYNADGAGGSCHNVHDNILENWYETGDQAAHGNMWECVSSSTTDPINVFYNNILRNNDDAHSNTGIIKVGTFMKTTTNKNYWFNNVLYKVHGSNTWDTYTPGQGQPGVAFMFNNTIEASVNWGNIVECEPNMTLANNHVISKDGTWISTHFGACIVTNNVAQTATVAEGATERFLSAATRTCSNDPANPCSPIATSSTVGAGVNETNTYCADMLASSDPVIRQAGAACGKSTTLGCSYNKTNHTLSCPAQTPVARPGSGAWDSGAYEYKKGIHRPIHRQTSQR